MPKARKDKSKVDSFPRQSHPSVKANTTFVLASPKFMKKSENNTGSPKRKSKNEDPDSRSSNATPRRSSTAATPNSCRATAIKEDDEDGRKRVNPAEPDFNHSLRPVADARYRPNAQSNALAASYVHRPGLTQTQDWRSTIDPGIAHQSSTYIHHHAGAFQRGGTSQGPSRQQRLIGGSIDIRKVTPGAIFFHREVIVHYSDAVAARQAPQVGSMYVFQTKSGRWYIEKGRYFYVLKVFDSHWTECLIYTYQGQGLQNKSPQLKEEHVRLKPMHIAADEHEPQNEVHVKMMTNPKEQLSEKAVIHFTEPRSSNFNTRIRVVGSTDGNGVSLIAELRKKMGCV